MQNELIAEMISDSNCANLENINKNQRDKRTGVLLAPIGGGGNGIAAQQEDDLSSELETITTETVEAVRLLITTKYDIISENPDGFPGD